MFIHPTFNEVPFERMARSSTFKAETVTHGGSELERDFLAIKRWSPDSDSANSAATSRTFICHRRNSIDKNITLDNITDSIICLL